MPAQIVTFQDLNLLTPKTMCSPSKLYNESKKWGELRRAARKVMLCQMKLKALYYDEKKNPREKPYM